MSYNCRRRTGHFRDRARIDEQRAEEHAVTQVARATDQPGETSLAKVVVEEIANQKLEPTVIAIEACGGSHHWARLLQSFGHTVKLIPPQLVKPYVKRGKNDSADAEALCEAMSRPTMRFVPMKTTEQRASLMLVGLRDRLIRNRTQLANAIRGYATEFGLTGAKGMAPVGSAA
jgi:transposase